MPAVPFKFDRSLTFARIETQDVLLAQMKVERLIEIGPGSTLVNMAKQTIAAKYQDSDMAFGLHRRLLSLKLNAKEIFYEEDPNSHDSDPSNKDTPREDAAKNVSDAPTIPVVLPSIVAPQLRSALPSAPITATEVVKAIIAFTLKVPIAKISMDNDTVRSLAAGLLLIQRASQTSS